MKVATHAPILNPSHKILDKIALFWDKISYGWKTVLGPHIHHGFYELGEEPVTFKKAQEQLIEELVKLLALEPKLRVLDVGCGMGGSSCYLAKKYDVNVVGITLSRTQLKIAQDNLPIELAKQVSFEIEDAHDLSRFSDNMFDVVWSLESCEQFYDKKLFIAQALRVLKPGGKFMIATWCADQDSYEGASAKTYIKLCKAFDVPYMPTLSYYSTVISEHFEILQVKDWSSHVKQSWQPGIALLKQHSWIKLLKLTGLTGLCFMTKLKLMDRAFQQGQLRYGVFIARKRGNQVV